MPYPKSESRVSLFIQQQSAQHPAGKQSRNIGGGLFVSFKIGTPFPEKMNVMKEQIRLVNAK
jgi:hypothetical protein